MYALSNLLNNQIKYQFNQGFLLVLMRKYGKFIFKRIKLFFINIFIFHCVPNVHVSVSILCHVDMDKESMDMGELYWETLNFESLIIFQFKYLRIKEWLYMLRILIASHLLLRNQYSINYSFQYLLINNGIGQIEHYCKKN